MSESAEVLRIIAKDTTALPKNDRDAIVAAADELDMIHYLLLATQSDLKEANMHRIALKDSVIAMKVSHGY